MESPEFAEARTVLAQSVVDFVGDFHPTGVAPAAMAAAFVAVCRAAGLDDDQALRLFENAQDRVEAEPRRHHA